MAIILGIDAAWTPGQPSGVALVADSGGKGQCLAVAPSYASFLALAEGKAVDWSAPPKATLPDPSALLDAAAALAGRPVDIVTVDMPISTVPITQRRAADAAVSQEFGSRWCSAHTPNVSRPGHLGAVLTKAFATAGYPVATTNTPPGTKPCLVEIYPHPALLALLARPRRVPYKVAKAQRYWPERTVAERSDLLLNEFRAIATALDEILGPFEIPIPTSPATTPLSRLKRLEDALDALVCCWVGLLYVNKKATALGDATGAVWCPSSVVSAATG